VRVSARTGNYPLGERGSIQVGFRRSLEEGNFGLLPETTHL